MGRPEVLPDKIPFAQRMVDLKAQVETKKLSKNKYKKALKELSKEMWSAARNGVVIH